MTDSGPQDNPQNHDLIEGDAGVDKPSQAEGSEGQADEALSTSEDEQETGGHD